MITTSAILLNLGRSLPNGIPEAGDTDIDIPSTILPVMVLQAPSDGPVAGPAATIVEGAASFSGSISVIAGVGGANTSLMTLSKGFWHFDCDMSLATNYVQAGVQASIIASYGNGGLALMAMTPGGAAAAPVVQYGAKSMNVLIPRDGAVITILSVANGAGQSMTGAFSISAVKLL